MDVRIDIARGESRERWRSRLEHHLLALDPASRRSRFSMPVSERSIRAYCDHARPFAVVFATLDGIDIGVAEAHPDCGGAEIAVSVLSSCRGRGIGRRLVAEAARLSEQGGLRDSHLHVDPANRPILRLLSALGAKSSGAASSAWTLPMPLLA